jgi:hypothetical protein
VPIKRQLVVHSLFGIITGKNISDIIIAKIVFEILDENVKKFDLKR